MLFLLLSFYLMNFRCRTLLSAASSNLYICRPLKYNWMKDNDHPNVTEASAYYNTGDKCFYTKESGEWEPTDFEHIYYDNPNLTQIDGWQNISSFYTGIAQSYIKNSYVNFLLMLFMKTALLKINKLTDILMTIFGYMILILFMWKNFY